MTKINVSYLVSYDYTLLFNSLKTLYFDVDRIVISIDINRRTWSGNYYELPDSFFLALKEFDTRSIIEIFEDDFYIPELMPMECETRQRNLTLKKLGKGWNIQLDVDEYIYEFKKLKKYLKKYWFLTIFPKYTPLCFTGKLITLFKQNSDGFFYVDNNEFFPFITNQSKNIHTRRNDMIRNHSLGINVIHQSWARSEKEVEQKILNWGHRDDFDTMKYINFWKGIHGDNYKEITNFHPIVPHVWNKLYFIKAESIDGVIDYFSKNTPQKLIPLPLKTMLIALKNKIV